MTVPQSLEIERVTKKASHSPLQSGNGLLSLNLKDELMKLGFESKSPYT